MDISFVVCVLPQAELRHSPQQKYKESKTYARAEKVSKSMGYPGHDFCVIKKHACDE